MTKPLTPKQFEEYIWKHVLSNAQFAGLDASKFNDEHRQVIREVVQFLISSNTKPIVQEPLKPRRKSLSKKIARRVRLFNDTDTEETKTAVINPNLQPVPPIIICGKPGTGKTTFLYLLDNVIRRLMALPDNIAPQMKKGTQIYPVHKRAYSGESVSLLSVRKWTQLLHFYAWDIHEHALNSLDLARFVEQTLLPMRILFADEVEMTGYSPTIPTLAKYGILVVGTSNQYEFRQLDNHDLPARIHRFEGDDMRLGNPSDAIVAKEDEFWRLFDSVANNPEKKYEQLSFQAKVQRDSLFLLLDLDTAVSAPMLETEWIHFFQSTYAHEMKVEFQAESRLIVLLDNFSLELLNRDFNAVIRFVSLFDAIEQLGLGILVRNPAQTPELSRESMTFLKTTIYNAIAVPDDVKQKTAVGLDRCTSRIGQAGHKAHMNIAQM